MSADNEGISNNTTVAIGSGDDKKLNNSTPKIKVDGKDKKPERGSMSGNVGTGKYAQTNIIWYIVSAIFVVFSCLAAALIVLSIYGYQISELSQSIKDIWGVFTPILTLALGYLFGKQGKVKNKKKIG
ncbi:hypothetical protein EJP81_18245 [Rahnella aquatilis]|jgi:hypothetical protein|nr:hypothetical protein EJP79_18245 [Rahnella aquatilis]AZP48018.1 hypothetical protein EJP81_18245 [Rahnella aquatilis]